MFTNKRIVLASCSPRRKQLLEQAGVSFVVKKEPVEESFPQGMEPEEVPEFLARKKAEAVGIKCDKEELIIAADTIVLLGDKILGKPVDKADAVKSLKALSGKSHQVITGVCLQQGKTIKSFSVKTIVRFKALSEDIISHYVDCYKPMDKAGAYAIQEWIGLVGVVHIEGDYFNVVGLPVSRILSEI